MSSIILLEDSFNYYVPVVTLKNNVKRDLISLYKITGTNLLTSNTYFDFLFLASLTRIPKNMVLQLVLLSCNINRCLKCRCFIYLMEYLPVLGIGIGKLVSISKLYLSTEKGNIYSLGNVFGSHQCILV
jgi:hypothetical protein